MAWKIESDLMGDHEAVPTLTSRTNKEHESSKGYMRNAAFVKFDQMLESPSIFRYLGVQHLSDNLEVRTISRKDE